MRFEGVFLGGVEILKHQTRHPPVPNKASARPLVIRFGLACRDTVRSAGDLAAAFHDFLQHPACAMKAHFHGRQFQAEKIGNLGCGERVGLVQQNRSAIVIGEKIETALYAEARAVP